MIQRRVFVSGRVQGVGFRASTVAAASHFPGLKGYVRNLMDGRVEAVFSGEDEAVLKMTSWCHSGPPSAEVIDLDVREEPVDPSLRPFRLQID